MGLGSVEVGLSPPCSHFGGALVCCLLIGLGQLWRMAAVVSFLSVKSWHGSFGIIGTILFLTGEGQIKNMDYHEEIAQANELRMIKPWPPPPLEAAAK